MARWGRADYKQLQQLRDNISKLQSADMERFCREVSKELAAKLLALVIPVTPLGHYNKESGKKGGTLRRGWTAKTHEEAEAGNWNSLGKAKEYANSLPISKNGNEYTVEIINPVKYASYVEYGHVQEPGRFVPAIGKTLKKSWVEGKYFLTASEQKLARIAPAVIERELEQLLKEIFRV